MAVGASDDRIKCDYGRCLGQKPCEKKKCFVSGCVEMINLSCYKYLCLNKHQFNHLSETHKNAFVCDKLHYNPAVKMVDKSSLCITNQKIN